MSIKNQPISFFKGKWYVREDFHEEPCISNAQRLHPEFLNYLLSVNNCFDTRQEARRAANRIRRLMNAPLLNEELTEREKEVESIDI